MKSKLPLITFILILIGYNILYAQESWALLWTGNHSSFVHSVAFSRDGNMVVSGSYDNTVKVWDSSTGSLLWTGNHSGYVYSVAFSPDGSKVVSGSRDNTVKVWDSSTGSLLWTGNHSHSVYSVAFSPDGSKVVSGSGDNTVKVWDSSTGSLLWTGNHSHSVYSVAFSPDGSKVVSGSYDNTVKVWDSSTGSLLWTGNHSGYVYSVAFSPDGSKVVSGSWDNTVKVWDSSNGSLLWKGNHSSGVYSVAFSPDGSKVVSGSYDNTVKVWDSSTGSLLWTGNHTGVVYSVAFSPDGSKVVSGSDDKTVKVWDSSTGSLLWTGNHTGVVYSVAFSPDGSKVVSGSWDNTVKVWTNQKLIQVKTPNGGEVFAQGTNRDITWFSANVTLVKIEYSTDNGLTWQTIKDVISGALGTYTWTVPSVVANNCKIRISDYNDPTLFDVSDGNFTIKEVKEETWYKFWSGSHTGQVNSVAYSKDGKFVVSGSDDKTVKAWDAKSGIMLWTGDHDGGVSKVVISPDSTKVASIGDDYLIKVWDATSGSLIWLNAHLGKINDLSFSNNGSKIVTASQDYTLKVWNASNGKVLWSGSHNGNVSSVAFSPDDSKVVSGSSDYNDRKVKLWDAVTGNLMWEANHGDNIKFVIFSSDGSKVFSMSSYNKIKAWDASSGNLKWEKEISNDIRSVSVSPDGSKIAIGTYGAIIMCETLTGNTIWNGKLDESYTQVSSIDFSSDGTKVVTGTSRGASILDAETGKVLWKENTYNGVSSVAFSPDGTKVFSGGTMWTNKKTINLLSPNGGESILAGSDYDITWETDGIKNIKLEYSPNNGSIWNVILSSTDANTGKYTWKVPVINSTSCKIRISDVDYPEITDVSDGTFKILKKSLKIVSPNGGETLPAGTQQEIKWSGENVAKLKIEYTVDDGKTWLIVADSASGSAGKYSWAVPVINSSLCKIRLTDLENSTITDISDNNFTILTKTVQLTKPNGGEVWTSGTEQEIAWSSSNVTNIKLEYSTNNGVSWKEVIASVAASTGKYKWVVPTVNSDSCLVRVSDAEYPSISDRSDSMFTIITKSLRLKQPNGIEVWTAGMEKEILWESENVSVLTIEYTTDNGANWNMISDSVEADSGKYTWMTPEINSEMCKIRIKDAKEPVIFDESDETFTILIKTLKLTKPNGGEAWTSGTEQEIAWSSSNIQNVKLEYSSDNGTTWNEIMAITSAGSGKYKWVVPTVNSDSCLVRVSDADEPGITDISDSVFTIEESTVEVAEEIIPTEYNLYQNYPNPFNNSTIIKYALPENETVTIELYNILGQRIRTLLDGVYKSAGTYELMFNGDGLVSGTYFIHMHTSKYSKVIKVNLLK
ncbi:MAG: PQQ-binding-like beta-propeller repeat protein [Melioribacter sp.]|uniref:outer membrane protein assembly factor BamB family protein n=1 Tax=Melioribacter sp. TaxID=2052167 RepID=UPI003BE77F6C